MAVFEELNALNINGHTEQKKVEGKELTYLSWPWAWAEVKKRYPDAHYTIWRNAEGLPYTEDPQTGYMVYTSVTIDGITHEMWLPVMNGANRAMKREPYEYTTRFGVKGVEAATMMDINKTIMRCLVKNLAMFGLGLYLYAGEDIPEAEQEQKKEEPAGPEFTRPAVKPEAKVSAVTNVVELPKVAKKEEPKQEKAIPTNPVLKYLLNEMAIMREARGLTPSQNNKLFKDQHEALIKSKIAPDKKLEEYTMQEAEALIQAMWKCFSPKGTELKTE